MWSKQPETQVGSLNKLQFTGKDPCLCESGSQLVSPPFSEVIWTDLSPICKKHFFFLELSNFRPKTGSFVGLWLIDAHTGAFCEKYLLCCETPQGPKALLNFNG